jgi:hypothetical protein
VSKKRCYSKLPKCFPTQSLQQPVSLRARTRVDWVTSLLANPRSWRLEPAGRLQSHMGSGCIDPHFLDLGTSWRWVAASQSACFTPRERAPSTHWIGSWVVPRTSLDDVEKKIFLPYRDPNSDSSVVQPVGSLLYRLPYPSVHTKIYGTYVHINLAEKP